MEQSQPPNDFATQAAEPKPGLLGELWLFIKTQKKWWLAPLILALLLTAIMVLVSGSPAAPFIYTLF